MATLEVTLVAACPMMCTFCPQDRLGVAYGNNGAAQMSLDTFDAILARVPTHVLIGFAGMAEPWANPQATQMLVHALERGRRVEIYTTLHGMSVADSTRIVEDLLPTYQQQVELVCLHLPDADGNMRRFRPSEAYKQVLKSFLAMVERGAFPKTKLTAMTMDRSGRVHEDLRDLVPPLGRWNGHARAGSLGGEQITKTGARPPVRSAFPLICASTPFYDHNVVLPNGDVVLCCMDYALRHTLGNLLRTGYYDLFLSRELDAVRIENQKPQFSTRSICKQCENVVQIDRSFALPLHYGQE